MAEQQHRATHHQWTKVKDLAGRERVAAYSTILELLHRIEALEAAAKPNHPAKPDSSLVERVKSRMIETVGSTWEETAASVLVEIAAWLSQESSGHLGSGEHWAIRLEQEANHRST